MKKVAVLSITFVMILFILMCGCSQPKPPSQTPYPDPLPSTPPPQSSRVQVVSNPSGATVEIGVKSVGGVLQDGTGRKVGGLTPVIAEIFPSDISWEGQGQTFANINVNVMKEGYTPFTSVIGLGQNGRLEAGRTYEVNVNLNRAGSYFNVVSNPPGATVEVGVKSVGGVLKDGTGRIAGVTPLTFEVYPSDINWGGQGNSFANINVNIVKAGYIPFTSVISLGQNGQLKAGETYKVNVKLNQIGSY